MFRQATEMERKPKHNYSPKFATKENLAQNGSYVLDSSILGKRDKSIPN